ncbi:MAG: hypothetical protein JSS59_11635 [Proteobacteria bacterium]|uniref:hypothetical protein n=1 Tax=Rudaea sp. TaxID=2136325 RepID=UPI0037836DC7|nr:hypothetical protein [Pseudomonadota bacterium]
MILLHIPDAPPIRCTEQVSLAVTPACANPFVLKAMTATAATFVYRVEYKLRNRETGSTGDTHATYIRAASEANVLTELNKQNPGKDVVVLSLVKQ